MNSIVKMFGTAKIYRISCESRRKIPKMTEANDSILTTTISSSFREFRPHVDNWKHWCELLDSHFLEISCSEDNINVAVLIK